MPTVIAILLSPWMECCPVAVAHTIGVAAPCSIVDPTESPSMTRMRMSVGAIPCAHAPAQLSANARPSHTRHQIAPQVHSKKAKGKQHRLIGKRMTMMMTHVNLARHDGNDRVDGVLEREQHDVRDLDREVQRAALDDRRHRAPRDRAR